ncbi:uncharacterized protein [Bemisia tabaci]|uniref:uncharacterized protein n=1 Tax=Bemisia tabaci TaxID=7038 RepID=UPI003B27CA03
MNPQHFLGIAILGLLAGIWCETPYNITPILHQSGIYYHNLGLTKIANDQYTLLSFLNVSFYTEKLHIIKKAASKSSNICGHVSQEKHIDLHCNTTIKEIEQAVTSLENKLETVNHLLGHNFHEKRNRRGLFDGVSYVTNWLFGIPDAKDAQFYSESISNLLHNNKETQTLMRTQVNLISDTIKNYNVSTESLKTAEESLNANVRVFNDEALRTRANISFLELQGMILRQLNLLNTLIAELRDELNVLIESILFIKQKVIHPSIITPKSLKTELEKIKLTGDNELPFAPQNFNNIYKYFTICNIAAFYDNDLLIFSIKIPLVTGITYNLFHLLPLPATTPEHRSVFSIIDTQFPYLLINTARTKYCLIKDRTGCTSTSDGEYICTDLVTYSTAQNPVCETELLMAPTEVPEDCLTRTLKANLEIWHSIQPNSWLFTVTKPTAASITCEEDASHILDATIEGSGILTLRSSCQLYTFSTTLKASSNYSSNVTHYIPKFNISIDDCCVYKSQFINQQANLMKPLSITGINLEELRHTKHKLDKFQEILDDNLSKPHIVTHSILYQSYLAFTIIVIALIITYVFCCKCCNCRWLPILGKLWPESNKNAPLDLSKICITNINLNRYRSRSRNHESGSEDEQIELNRSPPIVTPRRPATRSQSIRT